MSFKLRDLISVGVIAVVSTVFMIGTGENKSNQQEKTIKQVDYDDFYEKTPYTEEERDFGDLHHNVYSELSSDPFKREVYPLLLELEEEGIIVFNEDRTSYSGALSKDHRVDYSGVVKIPKK